MVICLERGADLHMAQLMPLPLTVSCFSKIQIGFAFLVPAHTGGPVQRAVKLVCVRVCAPHTMRAESIRVLPLEFCVQNSGFKIILAEFLSALSTTTGWTYNSKHSCKNWQTIYLCYATGQQQTH